MWEAYHAQFSVHILREEHPICQLEAVNTVVVLKIWVPQVQGSLVHLYIDNATAAASCHLHRGMDTYIQAYPNELWLICDEWDISLGVSQQVPHGLY